MSKYLSLLIAFSGLVLVFSWLSGHPLIMTLHRDWPTVKFSSSVCFLLAGVLLATDNKPLKLFCGAMITVIMSTAISTTYQAWIVDNPEMLPASPSLPTAAAFLVFVLAAWWPRINHFASVFLVSISSLALIGYVIDNPALYYAIPNATFGMSIPTALLMLLISADLFFLPYRHTGEMCAHCPTGNHGHGKYCDHCPMQAVDDHHK